MWAQITFRSVVVAAAIFFGPLFAAAQEAKQSAAGESAAEKKAVPPSQAEQEKKFEETMRNVSLVGFFTASDQPAGKLHEERYVIEKVVKETGDEWTFHVKIQYGKHNVPAALKIPVKWAGDTAVISVTKMAVPLLGTFDARVVIYNGQYAGTWSGAGHGGHLFGKIEKNKEEKPAEAAKGEKK